MTANHSSYPDTHHDISSNTIFGFWLYLMTDCVMFATFFAVYAVLKNATFGGPTASEIFDLRYILIETLILLASSFTCGIALLFAPREQKQKLIGCLAVTFVLGSAFLAMGLTDLGHLLDLGYSWTQSGFLSAYFTLIAIHAVHILVGLLLMILFVLELLRRGFTAAVLRRLTCFRIYWQFLYLIWIFTFSIVYLIGAK